MTKTHPLSSQIILLQNHRQERKYCHRDLRSKRHCYQFSFASPTLVTRGMATRRQGMQSKQHVAKAPQQAVPHQPPCVPCTRTQPACWSLLMLKGRSWYCLCSTFFHCSIQIFHNVDPVSKVHLRENSCSKPSFLLQPESQSRSCAAVGSWLSGDAAPLIL